MLRAAAAILGKDLRLMAQGGQGVVQAVLLGLLLVFVFSLSRPAGALFPAQAAAAVFWLASLFAMVLVFNGLYSLEDAGGARLGLVLAPAPVLGVWLGKALAGAILIVICQIVFLPAAVVFLGQSGKGSAWHLLFALAATDWALCALGSLLGALTQGQAARESILSVILFPLLLPALLAAIKLTTAFFDGGSPDDLNRWLGLALAFDAMFTAAALILFPHVYSGED